MKVKEVIKAHGFTLKDVAASMGISNVTLSQNLSRNPTIATLRRIAAVVNCELGEFFSDEMPKDTASQSSLICPHCGNPIHVKLETE